uniref:Uncharacterized protein n=1 Tax=Peronospora matthiolae TaxID=2874970 RepID=A0AAV1U5E2_9STRA
MERHGQQKLSIARSSGNDDLKVSPVSKMLLTMKRSPEYGQCDWIHYSVCSPTERVRTFRFVYQYIAYMYRGKR